MRRDVLIGLLLGFFLVISSTPAKAITVGLDPVTKEVLLGNTASFNLVISGLGNATENTLGSFDLVVGFNPAILNINPLNGVHFGDLLLGDQLDPSGSESCYEASLSGGKFNLYGFSLATSVSLVNYQTNDFILATLDFYAINIGESFLTLSYSKKSNGIDDVLLGDALGNPISTTNVVLNGGSVVVNGVNPVPEPSTMLLFGSGICGFTTFMFRKRAKS